MVVFLPQQKSWRDERESVAVNITEDIRVGIRGVIWIFQEERRPRRSRGCARGGWSQHHPSPPGSIEKVDLGVCEGDQVATITTPNQYGQIHRGGGVGGEQGGPDNKTNPSPTRTDRYSGVAVSGVGVARTKR